MCSRVSPPPGERTNISLYVYRGGEEEYHSATAPAAVVDVLVVALFERMGDKSAEALSRLHTLKEKYR